MNAPAGIYLHVPFCAVKCPYCDFYSAKYHPDAVRRYTDAVCRNLEQLPAQLPADTVYFGGGTPSLLPVESVSRILDTLRRRCNLAEQAEITLEANPRTVTDEKLSAWKAAGINRLSLGVQSFQPEILQVLGRRHTPEQARDAVLRAYAAGFTNLSVDLMLGLSQQNAACFQADLDAALELPVAHLSVYLLKIEENTPFSAHPPAVLDEDAMADRYLQMHDVLTEKGFAHYEISNFAKPGFESRHNCKYWRCEPYFGIGPAAHSCYGGVRYAVPRALEQFCSAKCQPTEITEPHANSIEERIMLGLRLAEGIALSDFPQIREKLLKAARPLMPRYLVESDGRLRMTPEGWLISNAVLVHLLRVVETAE